MVQLGLHSEIDLRSTSCTACRGHSGGSSGRIGESSCVTATALPAVDLATMLVIVEAIVFGDGVTLLELLVHAGEWLLLLMMTTELGLSEVSEI